MKRIMASAQRLGLIFVIASMFRIQELPSGSSIPWSVLVLAFIGVIFWLYEPPAER